MQMTDELTALYVGKAYVTTFREQNAQLLRAYGQQMLNGPGRTLDAEYRKAQRVMDFCQCRFVICVIFIFIYLF